MMDHAVWFALCHRHVHRIEYPIIVLIAALFGWFLAPTQEPEGAAVNLAHVSARSTVKTIAIWLSIWLLPLLALTWIGAPDILVKIGSFFSTLAVVTFGGAYSVLAYMAQDVVVQFGWLTAGEMVDALGLAETTPGPLILVTQLVGFLSGFKEGGLLMGLVAALIALWVTFTPCFLWIFTGAPYIDWISSQPRLKGALKAITAAVVGVILNLSLWFALHVLFTDITRAQSGPLTLWRPEPSSIEWLAGAIFALSCFLAFRLHWGVISILTVASMVGVVLRLVLSG